MSASDFVLVPCLSDNYAVLFPARDGTAILVDAPDAASIRAALAAKGWRLGHILITHHHHDHVAAVEALKAETGASVIGPAAEADRIEGLDRTVAGGDRIDVGGLGVTVIATPGHTAGHVSFHLPELAVAFTGDTLFALGCGRLFEGTPADMWGSLSRLAALPDETTVYCGHEYTLSNARFALTVDPLNTALKARAAAVEKARAEGRPTVPTTIGLEKATNPFLRADTAAIAETVGLAGADAVAVLTEVRQRKDRF